MNQNVRVRFAPSPTGPLHIGGVRTALFNYLFAKKHNGTFYIRIEDTDQNRFVPGAEAYILEALEWLGIAPDETIGKNEKFGPYRQSERKEIYKQYADELLEKGCAYIAFDSAEKLDEARSKFENDGKTFIYNWATRSEMDNSLNMSPDQVQERINNGENFVVRFKIPIDQKVELKDMIRGTISIDPTLLDDKVLFKSDGMPTYHLANIVDDHLMQTTHVIRGEEWLPSMPLHCFLYEAFGWEKPEFAHLPLILKPIGNGKLSKRDGDKLGFPVFPLEWKDPSTNDISSGYREKGFFPEAVINFLALLGWNDGTEQEIFSLEELTQKFDLDRVHKAGAKFDPEKNKWFNQQYLQLKSNSEITALFEQQLANNHIEHKYDSATLEKIVSLVKDRANFVHDLIELCDYFFTAPNSYEEKALKNWKEDTKQILQSLIEKLNTAPSFDSITLENYVKEWLTDENIPMGKTLPPLRLTLVGGLKGPHLFDIIEVLGKEETIRRINTAINTIA